MEKVKFVEMKDGDKEDYDLLAKFEDKRIWDSRNHEI